MTRIWTVAVLLALIGVPTGWAVAVAVVGPIVPLGLLARFYRPPGVRAGTWYWRWWWFYGSRGLYDINHRWKARA